MVPSRRAVVLVLDDKAEVVHQSGDSLHSEKLTVPVPSVIRLRYFVKVPFRRRAALNRRAVMVRDGHRCQYCGDRAESIDHVVPRSRGGEHVWENVVAACHPCNSRKRDRSVTEANMRLRLRPTAPRETTWVMVAVNRVPDDWLAYLGGATTLTA